MTGDFDRDRLLAELFKKSAPSVNEAELRERVLKRGAHRRRSRRRSRRVHVAAVAVACGVLVLAIGYGAYALASHVQTSPVLRLTDAPSTLVGAAVTTTSSSVRSSTSADMSTKDLLATYSTGYAGPAFRDANVKLVTQLTNNVYLAPGEEFDFDKQIGPRTQARGFQVAPGITGPNTLEDVLGGAIAQVATTLFNAVCDAGLAIEERHNNSVYIAHYPAGRDAVVTGGGKNLRFVNDTGHYLLIQGSSDGVTTTFKIYGTKDGRKVTISVGDFYNLVAKTTVTIKDPNLGAGKTRVFQSGQDGRELKTHRVVTMSDGRVIHDDTWISLWPMYPETIAVGAKTTAGP